MARERQRVFKESLTPKKLNKKVNESVTTIKEVKTNVNDPYVVLVTCRDGYSPEQCGPTVTVGELIDILQEYDMDFKVYFGNDYQGRYGGFYTYGAIDSDTVREAWYHEGEEVDESKEKGHMKFKPERKPLIKK